MTDVNTGFDEANWPQQCHFNPRMSIFSFCSLWAATRVTSRVRGLKTLIHGPSGCCKQMQGVLGCLHGVSPQAAYTNMDESTAIYGGEGTLEEELRKVHEKFRPEAIGILNTCCPGIIGDDIRSVAKQMEKELGCRIIPFYSEGFKNTMRMHYGVHAIALVDALVDESYRAEKVPNLVNIIGELQPRSARPGGDNDEIHRILKRIGIDVHTVLFADTAINEIRDCLKASCNVIRCDSAGYELGGHMEQKYGIPYTAEIAPFGVKSTEDYIMAPARVLGMEEVARKVIEEEKEAIKPEWDMLRSKLKGLRVGFNGGPSRMIAGMQLAKDLDMVVGAVIIENIMPNTKKQIEKALEYVQQDPYIDLFSDAEEWESAPDHVSTILREAKCDILLGDEPWIYDCYNTINMGYVNYMVYNKAYQGFRGFINMGRDILAQFETPVIRHSIGRGKMCRRHGLPQSI